MDDRFYYNDGGFFKLENHDQIGAMEIYPADVDNVDQGTPVLVLAVAAASDPAPCIVYLSEDAVGRMIAYLEAAQKGTFKKGTDTHE